MSEAQTKREDVLNFIRKLKPYSTGHPLIRIGPAHDGGYLLPDDFNGVHNAYSPGVGLSSDFELHLAQKGIRSFIADASVSSPSTGPVRETSRLVFEKKFLGSKNSGDIMTLEDWVIRNTNADHELILQMDIEGAEYEVIHATSAEFFKRFRIIVIEFHHLQLLWDMESFENINMFFDKILSGFTVSHLHPNNYVPPFCKEGITVPPVLEVTFIRNDRVINKQPATTFPHPLDSVNTTDSPPFHLPPEWYSN